MLLDQRRDEILQLIERNGFVSLHELVSKLGASESTVRRDLDYLDGLGQIRRTRGGAAYTGESLTPLEVRSTAELPQKQLIGKYVADKIESGDTILLDGGTTTLEVARCLNGKRLQVVTNSLPIANLLVNQQQIELIFIGGYMYPRTGVALGPLAVAALEKIRVHRLIMGCGGITEQGLSNSNSLLEECEQRMIAAAEEVWVVADTTKFGRSALVPVCALEQIRWVFAAGELDARGRSVADRLATKLVVVS